MPEIPRGKYTVRPAVESDLPKILELVELLFVDLGVSVKYRTMRKRTQVAIDDTTFSLVVAVTDGEIVATGQADFMSDHPAARFFNGIKVGYIDQMYVMPEHRGSGVGLEVVKFLEDWLITNGASFSFLHAAESVEEFYTKQGYESSREFIKRLR